MITKDDLVGFLERLTQSGATFREVGDGLWAVRPSADAEFDVLIHHSPPVVLLTVKVMEVPADPAHQARLNRRLLEWNATDLVHGAYGISDGAIVITEALEIGHLDYEEFLAAYDAITLALAAHVRALAADPGVR